MRGLLFPLAVCLFGTCLCQIHQQSSSGNAGSPLGQSFTFGTAANQLGQSSGFGNAGGPSTPAGSCTAQESREAFNRCMYMFGFQHLSHFSTLRRQNYCQTHVFDCQEVDSLIRCLNSQPTTVISNMCWLRIKDELTQALHRYRLPCSYQDLETHCKDTVRQLLPMPTRPTRGNGQNQGWVSQMLQLLQLLGPILMMMTALGGGGGFFGNMFKGMGGVFGY